jgi:hypothetical protein
MSNLYSTVSSLTKLCANLQSRSVRWYTANILDTVSQLGKLFLHSVETLM